MDIDAPFTIDRYPAPMSDPSPQRVLFLCTHHSARSQMAEGLLRATEGNRFAAFSAGTRATRVRPEAIEAMREIGIDIGSQTSKDLSSFKAADFDWLITVCDQAREACPVMPGVANQLHWSISDPAEVEGSSEERMVAFRAARDDLRQRIGDFARATLDP